jgi:hypothetical protein
MYQTLSSSAQRRKNYKPLNASRMSNGTYVLQLILNEEVVATEKFVILK